MVKIISVGVCHQLIRIQIKEKLECTDSLTAG